MTWRAQIPGSVPPRRRNEIKRIRKSQRYIDAVRGWRRRFPICQWPGCTRCSTETHHIEPMHIAPHRFDDQTNMMALCAEHHEAIHTPPHVSGDSRGAGDHGGSSQKCRQKQTSPKRSPWTLSPK